MLLTATLRCTPPHSPDASSPQEGENSRPQQSSLPDLQPSSFQDGQLSMMSGQQASIQLPTFFSSIHGDGLQQSRAGSDLGASLHSSPWGWQVNRGVAQSAASTSTNSSSLQPGLSFSSPVDSRASSSDRLSSSAASSSSGEASVSGHDGASPNANSNDLELLVGSAEVSFDRSTHGRHLFLNPPEVRQVLCNGVFCVDEFKKSTDVWLLGMSSQRLFQRQKVLEYSKKSLLACAHSHNAASSVPVQYGS